MLMRFFGGQRFARERDRMVSRVRRRRKDRRLHQKPDESLLPDAAPRSRQRRQADERARHALRADEAGQVALADALEVILRDRSHAERLGQAGYQAVRDQHSSEQMAGQTAAFYQAVLGRVTPESTTRPSELKT